MESRGTVGDSTLFQKEQPDVRLSLEEKVALFRSLFRGREDVFARRWYSRTSDKSGYQPVCLNEWNRAFCDKRSLNVRNVPIANSRRFPMRMCISTWRESIQKGVM